MRKPISGLYLIRSYRVNVVELKEVCNTLTNFVPFVSVRPLTDLVALATQNGYLYLAHTDKDNATIIGKVKCSTEIKPTVVSLSKLFSLVKLTTKETVKLTRKDDYVEFKGNGIYKIRIQLDEMGNEFALPINIPNKPTTMHTITTKDIHSIFTRCSFLIDENNMPEMLCTYYSDGIRTVTTNSIAVASINHNLGITEINPRMMKSLMAIPNDFEIGAVDCGYRIANDTYSAVYRVENSDTFPKDIVIPFITDMARYRCSVNVDKKALLDSLKRELVFKNSFEPLISYLTFNSNCVKLENKEKDFFEEIPCNGTANGRHIVVDTERLINIAKHLDDNIVIYIGDVAICLEDSLGKYVLASADEKGND